MFYDITKPTKDTLGHIEVSSVTAYSMQSSLVMKIKLIFRNIPMVMEILLHAKSFVTYWQLMSFITIIVLNTEQIKQGYWDKKANEEDIFYSETKKKMILWFQIYCNFQEIISEPQHLTPFQEVSAHRAQM